MTSTQSLCCRPTLSVAVLVSSLLAGTLTPAAAEELQFSTPSQPTAALSGSLVICGGGQTPREIRDKFVELAGGEKARIIVIPTASPTADLPSVRAKLDVWDDYKLESLKMLHTRSRETADDPEFVRPLEEATGVWFTGGYQGALTEAYLGTRVEAALCKVLERGGVVGGTSAGAAIMSPVMICEGIRTPRVCKGFGFLPGTVVDQHFLTRNRLDRLRVALTDHPGLAGIGVDERTAVVVQGRRATVLGESKVLACLSASSERPEKILEFHSGDVFDIVALSRAAIARAAPLPVPREPATPKVASGTLVLAGPQGTTPEVAKKFIDAAGGPDAALVVVSTADNDDDSVTGWLTDAGATNVHQLSARDRTEAESQDSLDMLAKAGGVWFSGRRQWQFVDTYLDTTAEKLFHEVLERGGAIGGSSAGAAIQGSYLVRGNPSADDTLQEGYERGLGFLDGVAIEPIKENASIDAMKQVKRSFPQLIGLGIDDATALVVQGTVLEVVGHKKVSVFANNDSDPDREVEHEILAAGDRYDLVERHRLESVVGPTTDAAASPLGR